MAKLFKISLITLLIIGALFIFVVSGIVYSVEIEADKNKIEVKEAKIIDESKLKNDIPLNFIKFVRPGIGPEIEDRILDKLEIEEEVRVVIILEDDVELKKLSGKKLSKEKFELRKEKIREKQDRILGRFSKNNFKLRHKYKTLNALSGFITQEGINELIDEEDINKIYLDRKAYASLSESVPLIKADDVWALNYTGSGETVCVVDTGVDYTHEDLGGCFGSGCKVIGGYDYVNDDNDPMDDGGHGTHCAGIAASQNPTYKGVAPAASIVAMKVLDNTGFGTFSDIAAGVDWCTNNKNIYGISIINMSLGDGYEYNDPSVCDDNWIEAQAVNFAASQGIFVSVASGNEAYSDGISSPACASGATSVGATYDVDFTGYEIGWGCQYPSCPIYLCRDISPTADDIICITNRDEILDLLAPGYEIYSTKLGGGFEPMGGTSMSTSHVAGLAALMLQADNTLTPSQIRDIMKNTGVSIYDPVTGLYFPRIDALAAINSLTPPVSITLTTDGSVDFGIVALETTVDSSGDIQTVSVDSGSANLKVKTTLFSDNGNSWSLGSTNGDNQAKWEFSPDTSTWNAFLAPDTLYDLANNVAQGGIQDIYFRLTMPTETSSGDQYGVTVTIVTTAP